VTRPLALPTALILLALACGVRAQDALSRATTALEQRDLPAARAALAEILAAQGPSRNDTLQASLVAFRDAGASDAWLEGAGAWFQSHPDDAAVAFYLGTTWQDLKHLRRADDVLARAHALAPGNPAVRESYAWNAKLRFDSAAVLERVQGATFPGADRMKAEEEGRRSSGPGGSLVLFGAVGLGMLLGTLFVLRRLAGR
jgi:hypothetical protein